MQTFTCSGTLLLGILLPFVIAVPTPNIETRDGLNKYIVTFNSGVDVQAHTNWVDSVHRRSLSRRQTAGIQQVFRVIPGYTGEFDEQTIAEIEANPDVKAVELDSPAYVDLVSEELDERARVSQTNSTYGLAAISHVVPQDNVTTGIYSYEYDSTAGDGTYGYIVDTGIQINHVDFGGRAQYGYNVNATEGAPEDDFGHGTHVAGTIGSLTYGVAKQSQLIAVKVLRNGSGTLAGILDGYDWAVNDIIEKARTTRAVINMSLRTAPSALWQDAIKSAYDAGVVTVVSAGNARTNATSQGPAYVPEAITVGATDANYSRAVAYSNYGEVVDVFAPGDRVLSTYYGGGTGLNNRTTFLSGTSMSTPHVAGLVLYLQALEGLKDAQAVADRIVELSTKDTVANAGPGSPNRFANNGIGA